jgi:hypothetical protein
VGLADHIRNAQFFQIHSSQHRIRQIGTNGYDSAFKILGAQSPQHFLISGIAFIVASLFTDNEILSPVLGVVGCSCLWSILEVFEQRQRVKKGWFPMNPKRKHEYENVKIK